MAEDTEKHKEGIGEFIQKTRAELDKTTFPSRDDVQNTTIIVIISVIFFAAYLFAVDHIWTWLIDGLGWLINKIVGI
ncbi:MAG TPA: preprotein translocase subunit SecE [Nitrospiraceae bacterium]